MSHSVGMSRILYACLLKCPSLSMNMPSTKGELFSNGIHQCEMLSCRNSHLYHNSVRFPKFTSSPFWSMRLRFSIFRFIRFSIFSGEIFRENPSISSCSFLMAMSVCSISSFSLNTMGMFRVTLLLRYSSVIWG